MGVCDRVLVIDIVCVGVTELVAVDVQSQGCILGDVDSRVTELVAEQNIYASGACKKYCIYSRYACVKRCNTRAAGVCIKRWYANILPSRGFATR